MPRYARVPASAVEDVERAFGGADESARRLATEGLERLRTQQQALADYLSQHLSEQLDEKARALGYMLAVAVFAAFERLPRVELRTMDADAVRAIEATLGADEELRRTDPVDALDSEDIIAIEQPALVAFVNDHVGRTLELHADGIDVDDVGAVFRAILVQILVLSAAVPPPPGSGEKRPDAPAA